MNDDWEDIVSTLAGNRCAYDRIMDRHMLQISRQMQRFSHDRGVVEELVQDTFVEAYMSLANYRRHAPFIHWLSRIATRTGYAYWRQQAKFRKHVTLEEWDEAPDPSTSEGAEVATPQQAKQLLDRLLATLGPEDRLVLMMQYLEERSIAEIAQLTGWSVPVIKMRAYRSRKKLRTVLSQWRITEDDLWTK